MKVAVSAFSKGLKGQVNPVFGRCPGYVIAEVEGKKVEEKKFAQNPGFSAGMGAGIAAAQAVAEENIQAVLTGNVGPNAFTVLQQAGIKVYIATGQTVEQALQNFAEGKLKEAGSANVAGHFGMGAGGRGFGRGAGFGPGRGRGRGAGRGGPPT